MIKDDMRTMRGRHREAVTALRRGPAGQVSYHFVGIGGCGMSGLAQMLAQRGQRVSGSDMRSGPVVGQLGGRGITVAIGHAGENLPEWLDAVVISAAVKEDNPEVVEARRRGVTVYKYAEMLGRVSQEVPTFAVAGTHGKSTTSGFLTYVLKEAGYDPSYVIGADVNQLGGASGAGFGRVMVVEACEYDRSFHNLRPHASAILNVEGDHFDYYRDVDEIIESFAAFAGLTDAGGMLVANGEDENTRTAVAEAGSRCEWFGMGDDAGLDWRPGDLTYENGCGRFELLYRNKSLGRVALTLAGEHNVANALAVAALAHQHGVDAEVLCEALGSFTGVGRRMTYKGQSNGVTILDDYAHHPTEIAVTLAAIRARYQPKRLWCVFQPHQHSRTRFLLHDFALSFHDADVVLLPEIYFVRDSEAMRREVSAEQLAGEIRASGHEALYLGDFAAIADHLEAEATAGDLVVTMGAGDIWKLGDELICRLGRDSQG